ncbi:hypothetical protein, partial [Klebsiella pneumoniae]|uniref:hypothetical protein n=1 Tax=Klebsiella pneumoniae TaxID=573 RepID=UPI00197AD932
DQPRFRWLGFVYKRLKLRLRVSVVFSGGLFPVLPFSRLNRPEAVLAVRTLKGFWLMVPWLIIDIVGVGIGEWDVGGSGEPAT